MRHLAFLMVAAVLGAAGPAAAGDLALTITHLRNADGMVLVAVCDEPNFLVGTCVKTTKVKAQAGPVHLVISGVPSGTYAVQVIHDENDNFDFDRNFLGIPEEGYGFSNNPRGMFGPPSFADAAVTVGSAPLALTVDMLYW